ncbi:uncharacterized protein FIBRA_02733 [Fibroporia radiculosa]|uniref:AB hydrolase-1 domain-containing protein n=1 Tax=Fibroporia radiculosa TaxID=599839 RepID=J4H207_9APHY|nr:uncharacterized protein FIBRA_02733 [Fibroporia radiculosa]CCM00694.1 predicted protein [Fibroporia radiculosa]
MPISPLDDNSIQFYYDDSGAPAGLDNYATFVLVHGGIFHSPIFTPMFEHAAKYDLRLVALNLRDYPYTTPLSTAELDALKGEKEAQRAQVRAFGSEIASFLAWYVQHEHIPPIAFSPSGDSISGGIALLGWSMGNCTTISMLANADNLPEDIQRRLGRYMRTLVIYDPPCFALGMPDAGRFIPKALDLQTGPEYDMGQMFSLWVSSYYAHSPTFLSSIEDANEAQLDAGVVEKPIQDIPDQTPTVSRMTEAQLAGCVDYSVLGRSFRALIGVDRTVYDNNTRHGLFSKPIWPCLKVEYLWFDMSPGEVVYLVWYIHKLLNEARPVESREINEERFYELNSTLAAPLGAPRSHCQTLREPDEIALF